MLALAALGASAASLAFCDRAPPRSGAQQDRVLGFAAVVRGVLEGSGAQAALVARSGLDLARFGQRYSHAGISLRASANAPWSVRQLYYACDEGLPRLFDQGIAGFVSALDDVDEGYVSIVTLPAAEGAALERRALDNAYALALLGRDYSANAYPFSDRFQNCNQWVAEMLAGAWGGLEGDALRVQAQQWLREHGFVPTRVDASSLWLTLARPFVPFVHVEDHPDEERVARRYGVALPASIEAFVRAAVPGAERIEVCHAGGRVVVHRGWAPVGAGCAPGDGDAVVELDDPATSP